MPTGFDGTTRRDALKLTGVAVATVAGSGVVSADHEHPDVETLPATQNTYESATLNGDLLDIGASADFATVWFQWGPAYQDDFPYQTTSQVKYSTGEFSDTIDGLERGDYQFRAAAKDSDDYFAILGDTRIFSAGHKQ